MSFMLKTLERLIFWYVQDVHMQRRPLHDRVYSYREGYSTETALHRVTYKIEKHLANKEFVLGVFLDISGAFSNASISGMVDALASRGVEKQIVDWVKSLLSDRELKTRLGDAEHSKKVSEGCAEGGVGSPPHIQPTGG